MIFKKLPHDMLIKRTFFSRLMAKENLPQTQQRKKVFYFDSEKIHIDTSIIKNYEYLKYKNKDNMWKPFRAKTFSPVPGIPKINLYFLPKKHNLFIRIYFR